MARILRSSFPQGRAKQCHSAFCTAQVSRQKFSSGPEPQLVPLKTVHYTTLSPNLTPDSLLHTHGFALHRHGFRRPLQLHLLTRPSYLETDDAISRARSASTTWTETYALHWQLT